MHSCHTVQSPDLIPNRGHIGARNSLGCFTVRLGDAAPESPLFWVGDADGALMLAEQWTLLARDLSAADADDVWPVLGERAEIADALHDHGGRAA